MEADGRRLFMKTRAGAEAGEYRDEAAGLRWLAEPGALGTPEVVAEGDEDGARFLALGWIETGSLSPTGAEELGRGLAELHAAGAPAHGWLPGPGGTGVQRIGSVALDVVPGESWPEVYAEQYLLPLARQARNRGSLERSGAEAVEAVCERLPELAGAGEPPARVHGDLWGGNVHPDTDGRPWLIDPSACGGHREMDLAMLRLFGNPGGERVFAAYEEVAPLTDGAAERVQLWQLQPLLVHAVLFGGGYGAAVERAARAYC